MKSVTMSQLQVGDRVFKQVSILVPGIKSVPVSELQVADKVQTGMKSVTIAELQIGV